MLTILDNKERILGTAEILITSENEKWTKVKAIIDPSSTHTFMSYKLANTLKLKRESAAVNLNGIDNLNAEVTKKPIIKIKDREGEVLRTDAYLLEKICGQVPEAPLQIELPKEWKLTEEDLADSSFRIPTVPEVLLGVEVFGEMSEKEYYKSQVAPPPSKLPWVG